MSETANIGEHYDKRSPIGDELRNGQLHMWYWYDREDDASLTEAVHRMTRKVTDTLGLRAANTFWTPVAGRVRPRSTWRRGSVCGSPGSR